MNGRHQKYTLYKSTDTSSLILSVKNVRKNYTRNISGHEIVSSATLCCQALQSGRHIAKCLVCKYTGIVGPFMVVSQDFRVMGGAWFEQQKFPEPAFKAPNNQYPGGSVVVTLPRERLLT